MTIKVAALWSANNFSVVPSSTEPDDTSSAKEISASKEVESQHVGVERRVDAIAVNTGRGHAVADALEVTARTPR
jgi:hypothetical protein